jgi:hypothetical protein
MICFKNGLLGTELLELYSQIMTVKCQQIQRIPKYSCVLFLGLLLVLSDNTASAFDEMDLDK